MDREHFEALKSGLRGELVLPADPGYDTARAVWNGMVNSRPAAVVQVSGVADIRRALQFAADHDLKVSVKAGGHGVAGLAVRDDALVLDLGAMRQVSVDPQQRLARVGAGARLGDLDHETQAFGLATTAGIDSRTGVAGLTLGGGMGFLVRRFGLTIDNLRAVSMVTADGALLRASESEHPDLFWAVRGGRGAGVATEFELGLHPLGPAVEVAQAYHPVTAAPGVLDFYRRLMAQAPDELGCYALFLNAPPVPEIPAEHHGAAVLALVACHSGDPAAGRPWLDRIAEHGSPLSAAVVSMPYTVLQSSFDAGAPDGARYYWKAHHMSDISDRAIDVLSAACRTLPGPFSIVGFESLGGAVARVPPDATAYPHRSARYSLGIWSGWDQPSQDEAAMAWTRALHEDLAAEATGGVYGNYLDRDDLERQEAAYGDNATRLREVQERYDPQGRFR